MTLPVFVLPELAAGPGDRLELAGPEGRHAAVVRRIGPGERIQLTDGRGRVAVCEVESAGKATLDLRVLDVASHPPSGPVVTVVQAIPKGERAELAVEVLTEVGVDRIVPWAAARSIGQWRGERAAKALAKWRAAAREAAKQSRRAWFPEVTDQVDLAGASALAAAADVAVVLHEGADRPLAGVALESAGSIVLVVGPEGGVAPEELDAFAAVGAHVCRLGTTVLRTSTAGVAAVSAVLARTRWA